MPNPDSSAATSGQSSGITRVLRIFGDVSPGETRDVLLMFSTIFMLLVAYYVLKTVREPLILATGGATLLAVLALVVSAGAFGAPQAAAGLPPVVGESVESFTPGQSPEPGASDAASPEPSTAPESSTAPEPSRSGESFEPVPST